MAHTGDARDLIDRNNPDDQMRRHLTGSTSSQNFGLQTKTIDYFRVEGDWFRIDRGVRFDWPQTSFEESRSKERQIERAT